MNWIEYWDADRVFRSVMRRMTHHFYKASREVLDFRSDDVVLDFGCGPGFLEECIRDLGCEIHAVDTSSRMITECRETFRKCPNITFHPLSANNYTDLSFLDHRGFTRIVVLSVVQYFASPADVKRLIRNVAACAAPGAKMLIADIPTDSVVLLDTVELVKSCWQEGHLLECIQFLAQTRFSRYSRTRSEQGLLFLSRPVLEAMIAELDLDARILDAPLTYNSRRIHLLVHF